ncbi:hypothetical protein [Tropicimonas sp. S265A]|uniref:hypothetical protein n=1 Tax=Tropicimonas sp. S265A TaxID=3415134 RepID=UPI003C7B7D44
MNIKEPMVAGLFAGLVSLGATAATFEPDPVSGPNILSGTEAMGEVGDAAVEHRYPGLSDALGEVTYLISNADAPSVPDAPTTDLLFEHAAPNNVARGGPITISPLDRTFH